jgi:hypothetical protein
LLAVLQLAPKEIREMKSVRRFCATVVLAFAVAFSTYAGEIPCGVTGTPPQSTAQATTTGNIGTGVTGDMGAGGIATGSTTNFFLSVFQGLMSLF